MGKIANCQSLAFSEARSSLAGHSASLRGTTVSRVNANRAIGIAAQRMHCLEGPISVFWGRYDCQWTPVIRIAAKILASDSAITLARFRPSEVGICYMPTSSRFRCVMHPSWRLTAHMLRVLSLILSFAPLLVDGLRRIWPQKFGACVWCARQPWCGGSSRLKNYIDRTAENFVLWSNGPKKLKKKRAAFPPLF